MSFDRCALVAIIYPLAGMLLVWVMTGEADEVGVSLGLPRDAEPRSRVLALVAVAGLVYTIFGFAKAEGRANLRWGAAFAVAVAVVYLTDRAVATGRLGRFWLVFWRASVSVIYLSLPFLAWIGAPRERLLFVLLLALVPLLNLPRDWASIGLTRGLLRRGCAADARRSAPFILSILDFVAGLVLLLALVVVLIVGLQLADAMIPPGGGEPVINVREKLEAIYLNPRVAEHWWVYLTLFSTLLPSAVNVLAGTISLTTVLAPWNRARLIRRITRLQDKGYDATRWRIAVMLNAPVAAGTALAGVILWGIVLMLF